jgi:hypothetical protein
MIGVLDLKGDIAHTVAVHFDMFGCGMLGIERRRQYKVDPILFHQVTRYLTITRFKPSVGRPRKSKSFAVVKLRLLRIADVELNVMYLFQS